MSRNTTSSGDPALLRMNTPSLQPSITVTGCGRVLLRPDKTRLSIELQILAPSFDQAWADLENRREAVLGALGRGGIAAASVVSDGPAWAPKHTYEKETWHYKGVCGNETLVAEFAREQGRIATLMRELAPLLGQTRINISHFPEDVSNANSQALAAAVADATDRATVIARAAGLRLGGIQRLEHGGGKSDSENRLGVVCEAEPLSEAEAAPCAVSADVTATWQLLAPA